MRYNKIVEKTQCISSFPEATIKKVILDGSIPSSGYPFKVQKIKKEVKNMRTQYVTRNVRVTRVTVLAVDLNCGELVNRTLTIRGKIKSSDDALKVITKAKLVPDNIKPVEVVAMSYDEVFYKMKLDDFIIYATEEDSVEENDSEENE